MSGDVFIREYNADYPCECQMKCGLKCCLIDTGYPPESCIFIAVDDVLLSESGAQGSRRPPDGWPSRPLHLPRPPFIPPRGNSRPPTPQNKVCRRRARAFLFSSPVTPPAFSLFRAQAMASPAISAAQWTGTALAFPRAAFYSRRHPRPPPRKGQGPRRPLPGLSCPLLRYANAAPALQPVTSFALSIVSDSGCLWQPVMGHAPPARLRRSPS